MKLDNIKTLISSLFILWTHMQTEEKRKVSMLLEQVHMHDVKADRFQAFGVQANENVQTVDIH